MASQLRREESALAEGSWQLLPLRVHRFHGEDVLLTDLVGEHVFVPTDQFAGSSTDLHGSRVSG